MSKIAASSLDKSPVNGARNFDHRIRSTRKRGVPLCTLKWTLPILGSRTYGAETNSRAGLSYKPYDNDGVAVMDLA